MGLDMFLYGRKFHVGNELLDEGKPLKSTEAELGYWRKHANLHGYIVQTFAEGKDDCQKIYLEVKDMEKIIDAIKDKRLPHTEGFFFGKSFGTQEEDDQAIATFREAIEWLKRGEEDRSSWRDVYYQASW